MPATTLTPVYTAEGFFFHRFSWLIKNKCSCIFTVLFCLPFLIFLKVKFKYLFKKYFIHDISKLHLLHEYAAFRHRGSLLSLFSLSIMSFISLTFMDIFIVLRGVSWRCLCLMHKWKIKAINDINVYDNFRTTAKTWRIISIFSLLWIFLQIFSVEKQNKRIRANIASINGKHCAFSLLGHAGALLAHQRCLFPCCDRRRLISTLRFMTWATNDKTQWRLNICPIINHYKSAILSHTNYSLTTFAQKRLHRCPRRPERLQWN